MAPLTERGRTDERSEGVEGAMMHAINRQVWRQFTEALQQEQPSVRRE